MAKDIVLRTKLKGGKKTKEGLKGVSGGLGSLAKKAALAGGAFFAARGIINGLKNSVDLSAKQEMAEKKLEAALGHSSKALLAHASALQQQTMFGDEAILESQALLAAFIKDEEQLKKATQATLDLAAAKGMDLKAAADLVGKTVGSSTNAMSRYGIEVSGAVGETERLESLTTNVAKLFGGQAQAQTKTLAGAMAQAKNAMGDAGEALGDLIAPAVQAGATLTKDLAEKMEEAFDFIGKIDFKKTGSNLLNKGDALMTAFTDTIKAWFDFVPDFWKNAIGKIVPLLKTILDYVINGVKEFASFVWEPIPIAFKIIIKRIQIFFIELWAGIKKIGADGINVMIDQFNEMIKKFPKTAEFLGVDEIEPITVKSVKDASKAIRKEMDKLKGDLNKTGMAEFFKNLMPGEGDIQTQEELTNRLAEIWKDYSDKIIELEEKVTSVVITGESDKAGAIDKTGEAAGRTTDETKKMTVESAISAGESAKSWQGAVRGVIKSYAAQAIAGQIKEVLSKVPPPFSIVIAAAAAAAASQLFEKLIPSFAQGGDFVTSGPQMMMVGDNPGGRERVQVTPIGSPNIEGPQGGITLNISAPLVDETVIDTIIPAIQKAQRLNLA